MNELALFAGAGGGILGGKLIGWRTVCAVECDPYARDVLVARQNDGCLNPFPIWDDVCTFDGRPWQGIVDVVSGGFPCQDISAAGKGAGIDGKRSGLWREMARIILEVGPRFVLVENSPVLTSRGLGTVLGDLASMGYDARWGVLGAVHAGAPHKRERIWIVAHNPKHGWGARRPWRSDSSREGQREQSLPSVANSGCGRCGEPRSGEDQFEGRAEAVGASATSHADSLYDDDGGHGTSPVCRERREASQLSGSEKACNPNSPRLEERESIAGDDGEELQTAERADWWLTEPRLGGMAHGLANGMDEFTADADGNLARVAKGIQDRVARLRAIGNGQVPASVAMAWRILTNIT